MVSFSRNEMTYQACFLFSFILYSAITRILRKKKSIFHNVQSPENSGKLKLTIVIKKAGRATGEQLRFILRRIIAIYKNPTICQFSLQLVFSPSFMTVFVPD